MRIGPRIRPRSVGCFLGLPLLAVAVSGSAPEKEFRPAPRFKGATIPDPPRQKQPWAPPETSLPRFLARASTTLFEQGLADPRGCDYRAIEIAVGSVWSNVAGTASTHGWVLPERPGETTRFAVAWSGLVYPTVSIGAPADLEADVKLLETTARAQREALREQPGPKAAGAFGEFGTNHAVSQAYPVSLEGLHPIKVALLLRVGRADLAERVWTAAMGRTREEMGESKIDLTDYGVSYVTLANDLAWYHFDRAVCAHMRGDDAVALADARALTALQKAVEAKAEAMGFAHPRRLVDRGEGPAPYIDFLGQLPELLADHERRAREPKRPTAPTKGGAKNARIAALIADLDQVFAPQFGQPGGVSLGESPIVQALIDEGDEAVEPLIDDLEGDTRLTRAVHFHRDFGRSRSIMGAHEAAYTALAGLLKTSFFGAATTGGNLTSHGLEGRRAVADRIRDYWRKNRGVSLAERWYRTLADDVATPGEWLQAAGNIVQHENVRVIPGSTAFGQTVTTPLPKGARPKLRGEVLRDKKDPSVTELLAMRIKEIDPGGPVDRNSSEQFKVQSANRMATMLAEWDRMAALPILKARIERCSQVVQAGQKAGGRIHGMEDAIAGLTELRLEAADPQALEDYAAWVRTVTPDHFNFPPIAMFKPMWQNPDHPAIAAAAAALFEDPKSPWNPPVWRGEATVAEGQQRGLFAIPLLGLKAFRTLVIRALGDKNEVGTIETDANGRVIVIQGHSRTVSNSEKTEHSGYFDPEGTKNPYKPGPNAMPLRMADEACEALEQLEGIPRFKKYWPIAKRDEAIAATVAYLTRYGERFRENAASRAIRAGQPGILNHERAILAFDPLDHPATAADVALGRAIFSLDGAGAEVRRVALPAFPTIARWTKLEVFADDPPFMSVTDGKGENHPYLAGMQTGRVWQAEEVREGNRWRRFCGFVGRHALTRVPAEEVEFPVSDRPAGPLPR